MELSDAALEALVRVAGMIGLLIVLAAGLIFGVRAWRRETHRQRVQVENEKAALDELIRSGGNAPGTCIVCGAKATNKWPAIKTSWLDWTNVLGRLYGQMPQYVVGTPGTGDVLCLAHFRQAVHRWELTLAEGRNEAMALLSQFQRKLTVLATGGMLTWLRLEHRRAVEELAAVVDAQPESRQLTSGNMQPGTVTLKPAAPSEENEGS